MHSYRESQAVKSMSRRCRNSGKKGQGLWLSLIWPSFPRNIWAHWKWFINITTDYFPTTCLFTCSRTWRWKLQTPIRSHSKSFRNRWWTLWFWGSSIFWPLQVLSSWNSRLDSGTPLLTHVLRWRQGQRKDTRLYRHWNVAYRKICVPLLKHVARAVGKNVLEIDTIVDPLETSS